MSIPLIDQRPVVAFSQTPPPGGTPTGYALDLSWTAYDPDGRVEHYLYAIDPPSAARADTPWVFTRQNRGTFTFVADSVANPAGRVAERVHVFVVKAVDDGGIASAPAWIGFTSSNLTPSVRITAPHAAPLLPASVGPTFGLSWTGEDPDGQNGRRPVSYRVRVFADNDPEVPIASIQLDPDTLRRRFAPSFAGWDSLPGNVTTFTLHNLTPDSRALIAIVAIDEAGGYTPVFSFDENLLLANIRSQSEVGPRLTLASDDFSYTWTAGGFNSDPGTYAHADFVAGFPIPLTWSSTNPPGEITQGYRWSVDIDRLDDEAPRSDEATDFAHWSQWTTLPGVNLPGYPSSSGTGTHTFYLEAHDADGNLSLAGLRITSVPPTLDRGLLFVNDTWLTPDLRGTSGCVLAPKGAWPSAAELDTFLFAAGGAPMKCYPAGTVSTPGLFAGYPFDTLSTQTTRSSTVSLELLLHYRNVIWMVDGLEALNDNNPPGSSQFPMPLLRYLCSPGVTSPIPSYARAGGRLWFMGGGCMLASMRDYDSPANGATTFSAALGELTPPRLVWALPHWESETRQSTSFRAQRFATGPAPGGASYAELPAELDEKSPGTDPLPPLRTSGSFYSASYAAEFLSQPNSVIEEASPGVQVSALDTLYETLGGYSGSGFPIMTAYHGTQTSLTVFSGFPLWYFSRPQAIAVADFVLQRLWGMTRSPVPR